MTKASQPEEDDFLADLLNADIDRRVSGGEEAVEWPEPVYDPIKKIAALLLQGGKRASDTNLAPVPAILSSYLLKNNH